MEKESRKARHDVLYRTVTYIPDSVFDAVQSGAIRNLEFSAELFVTKLSKLGLKAQHGCDSSGRITQSVGCVGPTEN